MATPLQDGRYVYQFDGTYSNRFGPEKKLGLVLGGTYDWNGRGIDDIEPGVDNVELADGRSTAAFTGIDYRLYRYERSRAGAAGGFDYKASANSSLYLRGLFSEFHNYGDRWVTSASGGDFLTPTLTDDGGGFSGTVRTAAPTSRSTASRVEGRTC